MSDDKTSSPGIGYRRPPVGKRFQKGQSGNPSGRRKGSRNKPRQEKPQKPFDMLVSEEAYRLIDIDEDGRDVAMPIARAVIRSLIAAAAKGDLRAQAAFLKMVSDSETDAASGTDDFGTFEPDASEPREVIFRIVDPVPPK
ncbi:DUF5681 domain-containing protein [Aestuariivirga sp. YIM B02566]|uniref:Uncharacterized protein n=1 Tax=Taklimakanibacter albus TaxID=2800327 RepID=A0ACC5R6S8_9HYPH|nr:DUF5681 domain-containing protein [Aestuariivirga sp. YIM B02566]MBK1868366.1 hypothetical protein [Aestuariivirga sp. YIM B02566]